MAPCRLIIYEEQSNETEHPPLNISYSLQKLATLLLRIDTVICRVGDMHSENIQVHTVVFYYSGGERSVKCVRPALEIGAIKEEQRGGVRFLVAEGAGTHEIHRSMSAVYGSCTLVKTRKAEIVNRRKKCEACGRCS